MIAEQCNEVKSRTVRLVAEHFGGREGVDGGALGDVAHRDEFVRDVRAGYQV